MTNYDMPPLPPGHLPPPPDDEDDFDREMRLSQRADNRTGIAVACIIIIALYLIISLMIWSLEYRGDGYKGVGDREYPFERQPAVSFWVYLHDYQWPAIGRWFGDLI